MAKVPALVEDCRKCFLCSSLQVQYVAAYHLWCHLVQTPFWVLCLTKPGRVLSLLTYPTCKGRVVHRYSVVHLSHADCHGFLEISTSLTFL